MAETLITEHLDIWTSAIKQKSSSGRGSSKKFSLHGIKKLRELILELAVRGKLVPQDEKDEPASVLLARIAAEKLRLINEEKLRTNANENFSDEDLYLISPDSWGNCRLGNLAKFIDYRGKTPSKLEAGIRLITAKNVKFGFISLQPEEFISEEEYETWMTRGFPRLGDILFTPEAPLGNVAIVNIIEKFALAQRAICFQMHEPAIAEFLKIVIMSQAFQKQLIANATGMTATGIKASKLKEILVPIPPLEEQHRIVAKVDELMSLCDALEAQTEASLVAHQTLVEVLLNRLIADTSDISTIDGGNVTESKNFSAGSIFDQNWQSISEHFDTLFTTCASIDTLKQTILQLAVMGKLVPQYASDEPAAKLLERIAAEKAQLIADKKIKKQSAVEPMGEVEVLPNTWQQIVVQDFADIRLGSTPSRAEPSYWFGDVPWVSSGEVAGGIIKDTVEKITLLGFENSSTSIIPKRSLLMAIIGQGKTRGQTALLGIDACTNQNVAAFVFNEKLVVPEFVWIWAQSKYEAHRGGGRGGAQPALNGKIVRSFRFPLPPHEEQHRIVAKVDQLMALCDQLKARLSDAQTTQLYLTDTIV